MMMWLHTSDHKLKAIHMYACIQCVTILVGTKSVGIKEPEKNKDSMVQDMKQEVQIISLRECMCENNSTDSCMLWE